MLRTALGLGLALVLATSGVAEAQTDEAAARQHFRLGQAHYENGQFAEAAREFESAYRMSGRVRLLYNAYLAYRDMQDLPGSARTLRQFLAESTDIEPAERDQLQARLAAIEAAIARQQTSIPAETSTEPQTQTSTSTGAASNGAASNGAASSGAASSGAGSTEPATQPAGGGGFNPSPVGFIIGGVGVALGIGAIITGVLSSSDLAMLQNECSNGLCPDRPELRDAQSRGQTLAIVTDVLWVTGVVALATGVALIFALQEGGGDTTAGLGCTPDGCYGSLHTRF